jgi:hypothetical protein
VSICRIWNSASLVWRLIVDGSEEHADHDRSDCVSREATIGQDAHYSSYQWLGFDDEMHEFFVDGFGYVHAVRADVHANVVHINGLVVGHRCWMR